MGLTIVTLAVPHGWRWVSGCAPPGSGFAPRTLGSAAASAVQTAGPCRYPGHRPYCPLLWAASSRPSSHSLPPLPPAAPRSPRVLSGSPFPATSTSKRSTHAWMRLARSLCCGLLPGVPRGLWPPEIMPDMLQERELSRPQPWPSTSMTHRQTALSWPHRHAPFFLRF